jgi:hypothetical protein
MKVYKLFKVKNGKLYPLYVEADRWMEMGKWLRAQVGELADATHVKASGCGGKLSLRPGFHSTLIPFTDWIGVKMPDGRLAQRKNTVWCECEIYDEIDYTLEAERNGWRNGKFNAQKACLSKIPEYGFYEYKTNNNAYGTWYIADRIKVNRILTDEEVERICWTEFQIHAQPRKAV